VDGRYGEDGAALARPGHGASKETTTMSRADSDRNLLFGILALQLDFLTRDALIEGLHAWVLEKPKPLGEILVARGTLDPADRAALDVIVARHVAHHGDAEHSLAAVDPPGAIHDALRSVADDDLQASLVAVADAGREDSWSTRPEPDDEERLEALLSQWEQR